MSTLLSLLVKLGLDSSEYDKGIQGASGKAESFASSLMGFAKKVAGIAAVGAAFKAAGDFAMDSVKAAMEAEDIQAQLEAVIKSTGAAAGVTADQVNKLAAKFSKVTKFEDDAIVAGQNMLLTFTGIGKDVFPDVTEAMLDMSQAMGQDLKSTALQLGKALNNPAEGLTALTRVGVRFTEEQERMVKSMVAAGDIAGAQKIILKELATEFGGSAEAAGNTASGKIEIFKNTLGNLKETIGAAVLPILSDLATRLTTFLSSPAIQSGIQIVVDGFNKIAGFLGSLGEVKSLSGLGFAIQMAFGPEAGAVFLQFKGYLQQALDFFSGLWVSMVSILDQFIPQISGNIQTFLEQVKVFWDENGAQILAAISMAWNLIVTVVGGAITLISGIIAAGMTYVNGIIKAYTALFSGDWKTAWNIMQTTLASILGIMRDTLLTILESALSLAGTNLTDFVATWRANWEMLVLIVTTVINNILSFLSSTWSSFRDMGLRMLDGLKSGIAAATQAIIDSVVNAVKRAIEAAKNFLKIQSPSKVFAGIGENMMLGLAEGVRDTSIEPVMEVRGVSQTLVEAGQDEARNVTNNWYYQGNATPQQIFQSYEMARAMG